MPTVKSSEQIAPATAASATSVLKDLIITVPGSIIALERETTVSSIVLSSRSASIIFQSFLHLEKVSVPCSLSLFIHVSLLHVAWKTDLKYDMLREDSSEIDAFDGKQLGRSISYLVVALMALFFNLSVLMLCFIQTQNIVSGLTT